jgi:Alpha/beta hydrolase domain
LDALLPNAALRALAKKPALANTLSRTAKRKNRLRAALPVVPPRTPLPTYQTQRIASADPRLSLQERYGNQQGYVDAVSAAAEDLAADRLLLPADADNIVAAAQASNVLQQIRKT